MPIYDYKCERCDACFEVKQSYDDKPRAKCHLCGGEARRMFSPVPIMFKGSGFYVTDHKAENSNISNKTDSETTATAEKSSTETKVETKSEDKKAGKSAATTGSGSTKKGEGEHNEN
jgi:putative FmdB family regulatory protein